MTMESANQHPQIAPEEYAMIFQAIMEHSRDGLFVTDGTGKVVMVNRATAEMCEVETSEIMGRDVRDLVKEGFWNPSVALAVIKKRCTISLVQTTRTQKKILSTGIPIFDENHNLKFVLVNDRDISSLSAMFETLDSDGEAPMDLLRFELSDYDLAMTEMEGMVFQAPAMVDLFQTSVRASRFDISLIITGESGVGKSMVARMIHQLSERRNGPLVDINCGAIPESLLESELFGHEKGAFTGAAAGGKQGLFEVAHHGTLFLDEISEIPPTIQVKLLKFLETREILKVGAVAPIKINTRVIAATNQDLDEAMDAGRFRRDLYFRLNELTLQIPPLRERKEEIDPLIRHFLGRFNQEFKTKKVITKTARTTLTQYGFPGNVRELENLIKRLVTMTVGDFIRIKHLPEMLIQAVPCGVDCSTEQLQGYQQEVAAFELKIINDAIAQHGSQRKAATALGLSQSTLSRKLKAAKAKLIVH